MGVADDGQGDRRTHGGGVCGRLGPVFVQVYELTGPFPAETGVFVDDISAGNEYISARYALDFAQGALYAIGFAALALLGQLLPRLVGPSDSRGPILRGTLMLAGGLGVVAQLLIIGAEPVATSTQYCECGLLQEELMSRLMAFNIVQGIVTWLTNGAIIAAAAGLLIVLGPASMRACPSAGPTSGYLTALASVVVVVLWSFSLTRSRSTCGASSCSPRSCCRRGQSGSRCAQRAFSSAIRKSTSYRETEGGRENAAAGGRRRCQSSGPER